MNDFVLFLHFFGLVLAAAGGVATGILMRRAAKLPPEQAATIRALGPTLANVAITGIVFLWATGLILIWSKWSGVANLPAAFWIKLAFVIIATIVVVITKATYVQIERTHNPSLGARLARIGPIGGPALLLAIFFAAYAFH